MLKLVDSLVQSSPEKRSTLKAESFASDRLSPTFNPGLGSPAFGALKALADNSSSKNFALSSILTKVAGYQRDPLDIPLNDPFPEERFAILCLKMQGDWGK